MDPGTETAKAKDFFQRTQWYAFVRLLFLLAISVPGLISLYIFEGWSDYVQQNALLTIAAVASSALFFALVFSIKSHRLLRAMVYFWISIDIILITYLIFTLGGIESRSPILYVFPILISAALFGRRATYVSAVLCAFFYSAMIIADYFGLISSTGAMNPNLRYDLPFVVNTLSFFSSILIVIALAIDFITKLLNEKQHEATRVTDMLLRAQEIANLGSWEWDLSTNTVSWSDQLYRIYDIEKDPAKPLHYETYIKRIHPDDLKSHQKSISEAVKRKQPFHSYHRILLPSGEVKYIYGEGRPLLDSDGTVERVIGTAHDVTSMQQLDVAKREFVSLASHQLRTPASGVKAFLSMLIDGYAGTLTRKQKEFARKAYDANNRQLEIIDNLLNLASVESGKLVLDKATVEINTLVKNCISGLAPKSREKKQKVTFHKHPARIVVMADQSALQMAIDNLISNAIKYTSEKGTIDVYVRDSTRYIYIDVTDNGIGIAKKDLDSLFQKFARLNDPASKTVNGSGLGLYLAQYVAKLRKGTITIRSKHGEGSTFTLRLPRTVAKR